MSRRDWVGPEEAVEDIIAIVREEGAVGTNTRGPLSSGLLYLELAAASGKQSTTVRLKK